MNKNLLVALMICVGMLSLISASTHEVQVWNGSEYVTTEVQYDSGCITNWTCENGIAVKADLINPTIAQFGQSAIDMGYKNIPGEMCWADPTKKPDCTIQEVKQTETAPITQPEIKRSFCQKLASFFTGHGFK
jgi:hypothetical protein